MIDSPWSYLLLPQTIAPVQALLRALDRRHGPDRQAHANRVATQAARIALALNLPPAVIEEAILVGWLHEVGRPAGARSELGVVAGDVLASAALLRPLAGLLVVSRAVHSLAERWDGQGGPEALRQAQIPLSARIVAVVDAVDDLVHGTADHGAVVPALVADWLHREAGRRFDPAIVASAIAMLATPTATADPQPALR